MAWNKEQIDRLVNAHWSGEVLRCPCCNAFMRGSIHYASGMYVFCAECPSKCGAALITSNEDPLLDNFRAWTEAERQEIVSDHFRRGFACCPVDGAILDVEERSDYIHALCPRCSYNSGNISLSRKSAG